MLYQVIIGPAVPGKGAEATQWLVNLVAYANENYGEFGTIEACRTVDGKDRLLWVGKYQSFAAFEQAGNKWAADPKAMELMKAGDGLLEPGETHFYETLS